MHIIEMKQFTKGDIQALFDGGIITENNVTQKALDSIISEIDTGKLKIWAKDDFNPKSPPGMNAGVAICGDCGRMYWCTPYEDSYKRENSDERHVCEPCLLKPFGLTKCEYVEGKP